jgi:hypothetical protein
MRAANPGRLGRGFALQRYHQRAGDNAWSYCDRTRHSTFATFRRVGNILNSDESRQIGQITVGLDDFCTPFELSSLAIRG